MALISNILKDYRSMTRDKKEVAQREKDEAYVKELKRVIDKKTKNFNAKSKKKIRHKKKQLGTVIQKQISHTFVPTTISYENSISSANSRGHQNHGWLVANHSFSFANWYNPDRVHFALCAKRRLHSPQSRFWNPPTTTWTS